jgi:NAD-dependent SIR2 family protein deacetylase
VITQNVDGLHRAAGSADAIELHGGLDRVICLSCGTLSTREELDRRLHEANPGFQDRIATARVNPDGDVELDDSLVAGFRIVSCEACGTGILKPDVVFFGENVPKPRVQECYELIDRSRGLLVLGSSLTVMSGLRFVRYAAKAYQPVAIINQGQTRGDAQAAVRADLPLGPALTSLAEGFGLGSPPADGHSPLTSQPLDDQVEPGPRLGRGEVVLVRGLPALIPVAGTVVVASLDQPFQSEVEGRVDEHGQVVEALEFRPDRVDALDDDEAGVRHVMPLPGRDPVARPVVAPVVGGLTRGQRRQHLLAQPLPVEVELVALGRGQPQPLLGVHRPVEVVALHDGGRNRVSGPPSTAASSRASVDFPEPPAPSIPISAKPSRVREETSAATSLADSCAEATADDCPSARRGRQPISLGHMRQPIRKLGPGHR